MMRQRMSIKTTYTIIRIIYIFLRLKSEREQRQWQGYMERNFAPEKRPKSAVRKGSRVFQKKIMKNTSISTFLYNIF